MASNRFFTNDDNISLFTHVCTASKLKLEIPLSVDTKIVREERFNKLVFNSDRADVIIQKSGNDFKLFELDGTSLGTFTYDNITSLQVLYDGLKMKKSVYTAHLLIWLPKENNVAYIDFGDTRWYAARHIIGMAEGLSSAKHIMSRGISDKTQYVSLTTLNTRGLKEINGIPFEYLHTDCRKITFVTRAGLDILVKKPRNPGQTKELMNKIIAWFSDKEEKSDETVIEDDNEEENVDLYNIVKEEIFDIMPELAGNKIRVTLDKKISIIDVIIAICKCTSKSAGSIVGRTIKKHPMTKLEYLSFPGQGQRPTPTINIANLLEFMEIILPGMKMPLQKKKSLLRQKIPIQTYTEIEIHNSITMAFSDEKMISQYSVENYKIDLYIVSHNIAIECDEDNHRSYDKTKDIQRTSTISNILKCRWIRYNPYDKDFNIFKLIDTIRINLYKQTTC